MNNLEKYRAWLDSPDDHVRGTAINVLWHSGEATQTDVAKIKELACSDGNESVRRDAVCMIVDLTQADDHTHLDFFIDRLVDEDWRVQGHAARGIVKINKTLLYDPRVQPHVESATNGFVRFCAKAEETVEETIESRE